MMHLRAAICYALMICVAGTPFSAAMAAAERSDAYFESLKRKYRTDDPYNNRGGNDELFNKGMSTPGLNDPNYEQELLERHFSEIPEPGQPLDMSRYGDYSADFESIRQRALNDRSILTQGTTNMPSMNGSQLNINKSYKETTVTRNSDGSLTVTHGDTVNATSVVGASEVLGAEINHSDTKFDADSKYGDNEGVIESGRGAWQNLSEGTTQEANSFQAILNSRQTNPVPQLNPRDPMLQYGFDEVNKGLKGQGDWFANCQTSRRTVTTSGQGTGIVPHLCQSPVRTNLNSCQVKRTAKLPIRLLSYEGEIPKYSIELADEYTLRLHLGGYRDDELVDSRSFNNQLQPGENGYGKHDCRVYSNRLVFEVDPGVTIVSAQRRGNDSGAVTGMFDDTGKIYINGQLEGYHRKRTYNDRHIWEQIPQDVLLLPKEWYYDMPADARLSQLFAGRSSGWTHCEHNDGSIRSADVTHLFKNVGADNRLTVEYMLGIGNLGEIDLIYDIKFAQPVAPELTFEQIPEGCADQIGWSPNNNPPTCEPGDPACTAPIQRSGGFCKAERWVTTQAGTQGLDDSILELLEPMYPGDDAKVSWAINAEGYTCDPLEGEPWCFDRDGDGVTDQDTECFSYEDMRNAEDKCAQWEANPSCSEVARSCESGFLDTSTDRCYMEEVTYECEETNNWSYDQEVETNECAGLIPCANGECDYGPEETNSDFMNAMVMASVAQHAQGDYHCEDPADPNTCRIFSGEGKFCSWERSGLGNDCCEAPAGVDVLMYAKLAYDSIQLMNYTAQNMPAGITGTFDRLTKPVGEGISWVGEQAAQAWQYVTEPFTSAFASQAGADAVADSAGVATDLIGAATDEGLGAAEVAASEGMVAQMKQDAMNWLAENLPVDLAETLFKASTDTASGDAVNYALSDTAQLAADILGAVMLAYTIYNYIKLAVNLYSACHDYEMDMGIKIAQRQCVPIGGAYKKDSLGLIKRRDYCCFDSILARIVVVAAQEQLGHDLTARSGETIDGTNLRKCDGLTPEELANLDWDQIDLSEWVGVMMDAEILPPELTEEALTASGRNINNELRETTTSRTQGRIPDEHSLADRSIEIQGLMTIENVDCSYLPRPLVCEYGDDVVNGMGGN